jgi:hypothetical protein
MTKPHNLMFGSEEMTAERNQERKEMVMAKENCRICGKPTTTLGAHQMLTGTSEWWYIQCVQNVAKIMICPLKILHM